MEVQVAGRVIADMFDDGSMFLASFVLLDMFQHSGISKHELSCLAFKAEDALKRQQQTKRWIWQRKKILSGRVVTYQLCKHSEALRELSALCTEIAACKRSRPTRGKSDHGGSDGRHV